jgi:ABC-type nitrate/sulfonate/bicarbonate transport system ATPase subunit
MQQKDLLLPWRRALDNAALSLEVQGLSRETARLRAHELFEKFGLGGFERKYPQELSGGMRQRVALIRTLLSQKEIMLLDEPFGSLDSMTRGVLHKFLLDIWKGFRRTVLFVTHDLEEAISLSDRIYVLTARPSKVKEVVEVPLPRPRQPTDEGFIKIKGRLLELIEGEVHALED